MILQVDPAGLAETYRTAQPFPHIVIDSLFPDEALEAVLHDFPTPEGMQWASFNNPRERKLGYYFAISSVSDRIKRFLWEMNGPEMLSFLEKLTGIDGLIPDPYFGGGGLHQILPGGFLKIHADFNRHPKLRLDRRLNVLIYLNKDWREEWDGHLELWDAAMKSKQKAILPLFNRTVIFSTTDGSFHGHPSPLACPAGFTRKSVSLYYYTNGRPSAEESSPHDTLFQKRFADEWKD